MKRRSLFFFVGLTMVGLWTLTPSVPSAQHYPDRPIQLLIPQPPGASLDIGARILIAELEKTLDAKIIPTNKTGAASVLATETVIRAKKDGYTLLYGGSIIITAYNANPEVVHTDPSKELEPLGTHYSNPSLFVVRSDAPWKTFPELIDYARKNPGKLRAVSAGVGSTIHFHLEMIQAMTGVRFTHLPFEGGQAIVTSLLGGNAELTIAAISLVKPHIDAGKMRVLLTTNKTPLFPETPTITDLGYKENLPPAWFGLYAPAGIPEEARKVLIPAVEKAVKNTKSKIEQLGSVLEYRSPSEQKKMWEEEYKRIYEIAVKIGLRKP